MKHFILFAFLISNLSAFKVEASEEQSTWNAEETLTVTIATQPETVTPSDNQSIRPLGRGIQSRGKVLRLYCLKNNPDDERMCIQAQYMLFKSEELKPEDALGNRI